MPFRVPDPPDTEIAWCIQLYQSYPRRCLQYLRQSYPRSRVVLLVDGDAGNIERYRQLGSEFQAQLVAGEHLMEFQTSHLYVARLLQQAVAGPETYFFRIDSDTRVWRRFTWLPELSCAFGSLETVTSGLNDRIRHPPNVQGGCIGLTRDVCKHILAAGILNYEACVTDARRGWVRSLDCEYVAANGSMLDDFVISWAVDAAGYPVVQHPEVASYWRNAVDNHEHAYAVTHPHKDMATP
jgi:hypothetical protein